MSGMTMTFASAFLSTLTVGAIAYLIARLFTHIPAGSILAFCGPLGFAVGRFFYSGSATREATYGACAALIVSALLGVRLWLVRKSPEPR